MKKKKNINFLNISRVSNESHKNIPTMKKVVLYVQATEFASSLLKNNKGSTGQSKLRWVRPVLSKYLLFETAYSTLKYGLFERFDYIAFCSSQIPRRRQLSRYSQVRHRQVRPRSTSTSYCVISQHTSSSPPSVASGATTSSLI